MGAVIENTPTEKEKIMNNATSKTIMAIAIDFWRSKGRTVQEIKMIMESGDSKLVAQFAKPAVAIYNQLRAEFA